MKSQKPVPVVLIVSTVFVLFASLIAKFFSGWPQIVHEICWGWTRFLARVLPYVNVRWDGILIFGVGTIFFGCALHWIASWIYRHRQSSADNTSWKIKWTVVAVVTTELLFVAGVAATGVTHQAGWMMTGDQPMFGKSMADHVLGNTNAHTANQMKSQNLANLNFHDTQKRFPMNTKHIGWVVGTLPYAAYGHYDMVDREQAWNSPHNSEWSQRIHQGLINPRLIVDSFRDENGFGLSHFPGNRNIFDRGEPVRFRHLKSTENTLLFAETGSNFSPWSSPENVRDVRAPINSPQGFGEVQTGEIMGAFADGSVRTINMRNSPEVFHSFAGPDPSEPLHAKK